MFKIIRISTLILFAIYLSGCAALSGDKAAGATKISIILNPETGAPEVEYHNPKSIELAEFSYNKTADQTTVTVKVQGTTPKDALEAAQASNEASFKAIESAFDAVGSLAKKGIVPLP